MILAASVKLQLTSDKFAMVVATISRYRSPAFETIVWLGGIV
jgi:hypothetical protein